MAGRRTRRDVGRNLATRVVAIAEQLNYECSILLELYKKKEMFTSDLADQRLVSVPPPPSSQSDTKDKLWCLFSALLQCRRLLERAISKEEEELGGGMQGEYENQRKLVKERLALLLHSTRELLIAIDSSALLPPDILEVNSPTILFELKIWVYHIFRELDYWTKMTVTTLKNLPTVIIAEESVRPMRAVRRSIRIARR
ncbi:unnamed protein product [Ophioblennius macclurei]